MQGLIILIALLSLSATLSFQTFASNKGRSLVNTRLMYSVRVINNKKKTDLTVQVPAGQIILDTAETQAVSIPYSCRAGSCSSCVGKLISGSVDQTSQIFLNDKQIDQGYVLTCVATPLSDVVVEVDIEDMFYNENPDLVS
eukprot:gene27071-32707_t